MTRSTITLPHISQQTDSHCGPATLQLLFSYVDRQFSQDQIAQAAQVADKILEAGTRPIQLAEATSTLAPDMQFWWKQHTSIFDLMYVVHAYHWPIAVNWQGLFYDTLEEEQLNYAGDTGHYSVVIDIDPINDEIVLVDPYPDYSPKPRVFSLRWFEKRWWDTADDIDPVTGRTHTTNTNRFTFLVAPKSAKFPARLGMEMPIFLPDPALTASTNLLLW